MTTLISNTHLTAEISHFGAELISLKNGTEKEFVWEGNPEFWGKHSPVLFPIVGGLKDNCYFYNGTEYTMQRHGFAREMDFELIHKTATSAKFTLKSSEKTFELYPFEFELQIQYTLEINKLIIDYTVINHSDYKMPFTIGAHPAFSISENFENYSLEFEKEELLESHQLDGNLISNSTKKVALTNRQLPLNYQLFKLDALIFKNIESKTLTLLENEKPVLKVHYEDFPHLGIWTLINAPFLCIEPWFGYSDTIEKSGDIFEKESIRVIESNQNFNSKFSVEIF